MADNFTGSFEERVTYPSRRVAAVTPHDSNALADVPKALYVGTGGNIALRAIDDSADVTFNNVPNGTILAVRASHVRATGTTASGIIGFY
ncbi:spike base protein, RCAP_Rcc01079 family [Sphingomonas turrisvirgatae]|uniref:Uncharacterized protein n=1 Tax=Sphingomonas turrisvirgatae TaxID=1888892 RepID=A0A1E3LZW1_9SPHN|nr:hypothetical protein [Sphingomonas turrisvirgatae]ODP39258.1 hypothetical protein BFL28_10620 [Sphingomonas turrisvirgatae]